MKINTTIRVIILVLPILAALVAINILLLPPKTKLDLKRSVTHTILKIIRGKDYRNSSGSLPKTDNTFIWPDGIECAISLTFDDARISQIDKGVPLFDEYDVNATFYLSNPERIVQRADAWRMAAKNGHELGNHTVSHPCSGSLWYESKQNALENYSLERIESEMDSANVIITKLTGYSPVSFAYPCGQTFIGRDTSTQSYIPVVARKFRTGRGAGNGWLNDPVFCDLSQLVGFEADLMSFNELRGLIESAKNDKAWLILVGHDIDKTGDLTFLLSTARKLCEYAQDPENGIWIDNVNNVAAYISENR